MSHPCAYFLLLLTTILQTLPANILSSSLPNPTQRFSIQEASIKDLQNAFQENKLTSKELVQFYLNRIQKLNPILRAVLEVNPDALAQAEEADKRRVKSRKAPRSLLDGIPVLLKDNIATKDKLNTTAGSYALLGSVVPRDAGVVQRLRKAGAIILGKASMTEWANFRGYTPSGWCARGGQGRNPYNLSLGVSPCGSSSGSAIAAAANLAAVTLGTETDGSILCPSSSNSVVGIKPTLGLTSRGGVIPITPTQDTVGPICRTVADATYVLDSIAGFDPYDSKATKNAMKYIPQGGYAKNLKLDGLNGKRLGIARNIYADSIKGTLEGIAFEQHLRTLRRRGAILVDNVNISIVDGSDEVTAMLAEFKLALNSYLKDLVVSPVRSLADVIKFNKLNAKKEKIEDYGQQIFVQAQATNGIGPNEKKALSNLAKWSREEYEKLMLKMNLDAIVTPGSSFSSVLAIGGFPGITVPAGYDDNNVPFGICFGGLRGAEPKLIEIAYGFEMATKVRKPPKL